MITLYRNMLFTKVEKINFENMYCMGILVVFTLDNNLPYGGVSISKYIKKKYVQIIDIDLDGIISSYMNRNNTLNINIKNKDDLSYKQKLFELLYDRIGIISPIDLVDMIISECSSFALDNNICIVLKTSSSKYFSYRYMRNYALVIAHTSICKTILGGYTTLTEYLDKYVEFKSMHREIPKTLFVDPSKITKLLHISKVSNIKILNPRITTRPMEGENIVIARISAATQLDNCINSAVCSEFTNDSKFSHVRWYVYLLEITNDTVIVKPTNEMVPDAEENNEYWVLTDTKVMPIGSFIATHTKPQYDFSDMPKSYRIT